MPSDAAAWIALHSLYYHCEWGRFGLANPNTLAPAFKPLALVDAKNVLVAYQESRAPYLRQLAIAEVVRARDLLHQSQVDEIIHDLAHANGHELQLADARGHPDPVERFRRAMNVQLDSAFAFEAFNLRARFCLPAMVSHVQVEVTIPQPSADVRIFADPRLWSTIYPLIWRKSHQIDPPPALAERDEDPEPRNVGGTFHSPLFEKIGWVGPGSSQSNTLFEIRNLLNIDFQLSPDRASLQYSNQECLSTQLPLGLGVRSQGGIDHDSGFAVLDPAAAGTKTAVSLYKSLRFTRPKSDVLLMNQIAFVNIILLLESMVLFGAAAAAIPE